MTGGEGRRGLAAAAALVALAARIAGPPRGELRALSLLEIGPEPSLEIGVIDGDPRYVFQSVSAVLELADGGVAAADACASGIARHDRNRSFVRRFGGRGDGPGELRSLSTIHAHTADAILFAIDSWSGRLSRGPRTASSAAGGD